MNETISEHFLNPRNVGRLSAESSCGRAGSFICGAAVEVSLRIDQERRITDAAFKAAGCSWLVGTASYLTQQMKNELSGEAAALLQPPYQVVRQALGKIPREREHCVAIFCEALLAAITAHSDATRDEWQGEEALICSCFCVSESTIDAAIREGALRTVGEVTQACNAGGGCRSCYSLIEDMLATASI
jgi:NifU-like protein